MSQLRTLIDGLAMGEGPRWHDGRLWLTDMAAGVILAVDLAGEREVVANVRTLGLAFMPDGRLLLADPAQRRLVRREADGSLVPYADLSGLGLDHFNELVVDGRGNAYLNDMAFEFPGGEFAPGSIVLVRPDSSARPVADGLGFPNGMAVTPDNRTLIVAESYGARLTAFDIEADGTLSRQRVWASLPDGHPDGICLDAEGAVWFADVPAKRCVRVAEGGDVLQVIESDRGCFACELGGPDGQTLFIVTADFPPSRTPTGSVVMAPAPASGAGWI